VATLASVNFNNLAASLALAEGQVQRDQSQVQADGARLGQSQAQLVRDQRQLSATQDQSQAPAQAPQAAQAQLNAQGQTIGKLINIVA
jgi:hypothetical protein